MIAKMSDLEVLMRSRVSFVKLALALAVGVLLASCATMSPEECKVANWSEVGQSDGLNGKSLSHLDGRTKDCAKVGVAVNTHAYLLGRDLGLRSYCRLENAVPLGLNGGTYAGVCPPEIDPLFQQRFQIARSVYDLRSDVSSLSSQIDNLERRLRDLNNSEERRLKEAGSDDQRKKVREAIGDERRNMRSEISEADRRLRRKRDELRSAEFALSNLR
jgi:hypothetical protein